VPHTPHNLDLTYFPLSGGAPHRESWSSTLHRLLLYTIMAQMVTVKKGQQYFNFATDLEKLLNAGPGHLDLMQLGYGGFSWWHNLAALMVLACLSSLEAILGPRAWHTYQYQQDEFDALTCIRNAYVHMDSDLANVRNRSCVTTVNSFHVDLTAGRVIGRRGVPIEPYFDINGTIVELRGNTIRRMRALYLGLLEKAGLVVF